MEEHSLQAKIGKLIAQLEEEVRNLSSCHRSELDRIREDNTIELKTLTDNFDKLLTTVNAQYQSRISDLENEIDYLRELNVAQRIMMEDNLAYIKRLEEKLIATRSLD
ncbi:hypothetical protein [Pseudochryseolinea flava]|uniref:Uncharacterized protein n=1 Tax=Pseudochryseolinea flava TaxID=2059302 RepID=A0A364Y7Z6_9BACT|nr:hypothetical protein [Pseudochryseolinea flava]RAW02605.1 hypothetical protein DQQ10_00365 [Pseudochryseolinea flava]